MSFKKWLLTLALGLICHGLIAEESYTLIEDKAHEPILTPTFAESKTLKIRLANGLEAYIISDPNTDKSAAALIVRAGSWQDPDEYPGIAHFTEHMLFLGTKKYPKESDYDRFITENGGNSNAFTTNDYTAYMFAVKNEAFPESLDRFAQFFIDPLFNPSGVSRELQAIDQEYAKNVESDDFRLQYIFKELGNAAHPFHSFNMGNSSTLTKVSQDTLKQWHKEHYSSNLMKLVVVSTWPIEQLRDMVVKDFGPVENKHLPRYENDMSLSSSQLYGHIIYVEPVKNLRKLELSWELPPEFSTLTDSQPEHVLCFVLGHEGKESLLEQLKRENLADSVACGQNRLAVNKAEYIINIGLTPDGLRQTDKVIERAFQTIAMLRKQGIPESLFKEINQMARIQYQYQQREDAFRMAMRQAMMMPHESFETYPEKSSIPTKFDSEAYQNFLALLTPQMCRIVVTAPSLETLVNVTHTEKWLGGQYTSIPIPPQKLAQWAKAQPHPNINLPAQNPFIPKELKLVTSGKQTPKSDDDYLPPIQTIMDDAYGLIYYAQDNRYEMPTVAWFFNILTPRIRSSDAQSVVVGDIMIKALREALTATSYPAQMAGLNYGVDRIENGIKMIISGYSENAHLLLEEIAKQIKQLKVTPERFRLYKDSLMREYQNISKEMPIRQASEIFKEMLYKNFSTSKEKANALKKLSFEQFEKALSVLFNENFVEGFLFGNMTEVQAKDIAHKIVANIGGKTYPPEKHLKREVINLPDNEGPFYFESRTKTQGNAVILAIEYSPYTYPARASQQILMQAMQEAFFATLRTKQQTGYLVSSNAEEIEKHLINLFAVQSNTHDVRDLLARFELFIEGYLQELETSEIPIERFEILRSSLLAELKQAPKNLQEMGELLYVLAFQYEGDFNRVKERIKSFTDLTYQDFLAISRSFLQRQNRKRLAVLLKGVIPEDKLFDYRKLHEPAEIKRLSTYSGGS